jgi:hypothetical protein
VTPVWHIIRLAGELDAPRRKALLDVGLDRVYALLRVIDWCAGTR